MTCAHDHSDDALGGFVCDANQFLHKSTNCECATVIVTPQRTVAAMVANTTGAGLIARTVIHEALKAGRSTKCPTCAEAFDRMSQALAILETVPTSC